MSLSKFSTSSPSYALEIRRVLCDSGLHFKHLSQLLLTQSTYELKASLPGQLFFLTSLKTNRNKKVTLNMLCYVIPLVCTQFIRMITELAVAVLELISELSYHQLFQKYGVKSKEYGCQFILGQFTICFSCGKVVSVGICTVFLSSVESVEMSAKTQCFLQIFCIKIIKQTNKKKKHKYDLQRNFVQNHMQLKWLRMLVNTTFSVLSHISLMPTFFECKIQCKDFSMGEIQKQWSPMSY